MKITPGFLITAIMLACLAQSAAAVEVYQWTDENGVVHFSQWAPEGQGENVETVFVEGEEGAANGLGISEEDDPEGYAAHREQMAALRSDMEARREAEQERREQASRAQVVYLPPENTTYFYPGYGYRPPNRPANRPPGRPPNRPPDRPRPQPQPGNGNDDYPTSVLRPISRKKP